MNQGETLVGSGWESKNVCETVELASPSGFSSFLGLTELLKLLMLDRLQKTTILVTKELNVAHCSSLLIHARCSRSTNIVWGKRKDVRIFSE